MAEEHALVTPITGAPVSVDAAEDELERKLEKKRAKVRSAWISFVGRIVARIMGAVATISLGLILVQKYHAPAVAESAAQPDQPWCSRPFRSGSSRQAGNLTRRPAAARRLD